MAHNYALRGAMFVCITYMASIMVASPSACIAAAERALGICANIVIPSLFPFIFCGNMFIALGAARIMERFLSKIMRPAFGVSGAGALAFALGIISGYPVGAVCAASLYQSGECTKSEAEKLLAFCNNSGPMFIIGAIGMQMFKSYRIGILMYIVHILSAIICGIIFKNYNNSEKINALPPARDENKIKTAAPDIGAAVVKSVNTILTICGFIIVFAVLTAKIPDFKWRGYIYSLLEITGGLNELISTSNNINILPIVAFVTAFSGLSVMAQVYAITEPAGLSIKPYLAGKITQGIIAFVLMLVGIRLIPLSDDVFSQVDLSSAFVYTPRQLFALAIMSIAFCAVAIVIVIIIAKIFDRYEK